jgi:hypothetical protein
MGLYAPDPPAPPNPITAAGAQTSSNVSTALANAHLGNANVYGPNGSTTFTQTGNNQSVTGPDGQVFSIPQYSQTTTLSPQQQQIYDQQVKNQLSLGKIAGDQTSRIGSILGTPVSSKGIPGLISSVGTPYLKDSYDNGGLIQKSVNLNTNAPTRFGNTANEIQGSVGANDFSADRQRVEDALFSRLEPRLERDRAALDTRLRNQGLSPGSEAYNRAMDQTGRTATDARMQAILSGGQEQSRLFDMDVQQGAFRNAAQQQDYDQLLGRGQFRQQGIGLNNAATLSMGQFANAAQGQQNSQNAAQAAFGNAARQQGFSNSMENAALNNATSAQSLQQMLALRQAPINEISALMSGSQVSQPTPASYRPSNVAGTDVMGAIYNSAALANQNYAQQAANSNAMIGGIAGLGGSLITGGMAGGAGGFGSSLFGSLLKRSP